MNDFEVMETGTAAAMIATVDRFWESQWLIGYYSDTDSNRWYHDRAVAERRADRGA